MLIIPNYSNYSWLLLLFLPVLIIRVITLIPIIPINLFILNYFDYSYYSTYVNYLYLFPIIPILDQLVSLFISVWIRSSLGGVRQFIFFILFCGPRPMLRLRRASAVLAGGSRSVVRQELCLTRPETHRSSSSSSPSSSSESSSFPQYRSGIHNTPPSWCGSCRHHLGPSNRMAARVLSNFFKESMGGL